MKRYDSLKQILRKFGVKAAYAFGSNQTAAQAFITGQPVPVEEGSDLDIGLVFSQLPSDAFGTYGALYAELAVLFGPFALDLVFLQETGFLFQYEAICGVRLFLENDLFVDEYEETVLKAASDLAFKKREFERDVLEAIKDGYFEITRQ